MQTGRHEHITPIQRELHWLLVQRHIEFKLAMLMYKILHDIAPPYLSDECQCRTPMVVSSHQLHCHLW